MRLPEKIKIQRDALDQSNSTIEILMTEHGDKIRLYTKLVDNKDAIEKRLVELSKQEAESNKDFRDVTGKSFSLSLTPNRFVDTAVLKTLLSNPLEQYPGLVEPKEPVVLTATLETLVKAKALPSEALTAIKTKSFTAKITKPEEDK